MKRLIALILFVASSCLGQTATVTWSTTYQTMDGWGGEDWISAENLTNSQANLFFSQTPGTGIGLEYIRTQNYGCPNTGGCTVATSSVPDLVTLQEATALGAKVELGLAPPASLQYAGNTFTDNPSGPGASGACLPASNMGAFATFTVQWIQMLQSNSIPVSVLSVSNEPNQNTNGLGQCSFTAAGLDLYIGTYLGPALSSAGLSPAVMMPEGSGWWSPDLASTCLNDSTCSQYVTIAAGHGYGNGAYYNTGYCCSSASSPPSSTNGKRIWQSEVNGGFTYNSGAGLWNWDTSMADALEAAQMINDFLVGPQVSGWQWWQLADCCNAESGAPFSDGLTTGDGNFTTGKRYYAVGNWSLFVRSGFVRIGATTNPQTGISVTAFKNPSTNQYAIIAINQNSSNTNQTFSLSGFPSLYEVTPWVTSASLNLAMQTPVTINSGSLSYSLPADSVTTFVSLNGSAANTYYIAADGSDSNLGNSETAPWAHWPGMPNCSSVCASVTPAPGYNFILRGGDTWHYGNSSASPYTGALANCSINSSVCNWVTSWNGTSAAPIYWGNDKTWWNTAVCGSTAWCRPIFNGDNPISNTGVASCTYDETLSVVMQMAGASYNILDGPEFTGLCWNGNESNANESRCCTTLISVDYDQGSGQGQYNTVENTYIHGWTHKTFSCSLSGGEPTGSCDGAVMIGMGSTNTSVVGDLISHVVVDGSDTDERSGAAMLFGCYDVEYSVFRYETNIVCNNPHVWHDDLIEHINQSGDGISHGNAAEFNIEPNQNNVFYNLIFRHLWYAGANEVTWWQTPSPGYTDYDFNFLIYDVCPTSNSANCTSNGNFFDITNGLGHSSAGTVNAFNMTWVPTFSNATSGPNYATVNWFNNHCIISTGSPASNCYGGTSNGGVLNYLTDVTQTVTAATAQGYTSSETYAYSPTSGGSTIGAGTNESGGFCAALSGSSDPQLQQAGIACLSDTSYAVTYNSSTHTATFPGRTTVPRGSTWDAGTYQFTSGGTAPVITFTPSSLTFPNTNSGASSSPQTMQITNSGTAIESSLAVAMTTGTNFTLTNVNCGSSLGVGASCTVSIVFNPMSTGSLSDSVSVTGTVSATAPVSGTGINGSSIYQHYYADGTYQTCSVCTYSFGYTTTGGPANIIGLLSDNGDGSATISSITDNAPGGSSSYQAAGSCSVNATPNTKACIWFSPSDKPGATTYTVTFSGSTKWGSGAAEVSNVNAVDQICAANNQFTSTTPTTCSVTTTHANEYLFGVMDIQGTGRAVSSPFTQNSTANGNLLGFYIVSSTGTYQMAGTSSGGTFNGSLVSAYESSGATGSVSPTSYNFGTQTSGTTSAAQTFTFTNNGPGTVTFSMLPSVGTSQYTVTSSNCVSLSPIPSLSTCTAMVTFNPTSTGSKSDTLTFASSATNTPQTVSLSGTGGSTGTPSVCFSPTTLAFGYVQTSGNSSLTDTLTNCGTANLTVSSVTVPSSEFTVSSNNCVSGSPIATTATCSIVIEFSPTALGTVNQNVSVAGNQAGSPALLPVTGTGVTVNQGLAVAAPQTTPQ